MNGVATPMIRTAIAIHVQIEMLAMGSPLACRGAATK